MPDIKLKTRIQNKYKPLNDWNLLAEGDFIPLLGEVCYAVENGTLYQKIGDGITDFTKLEWLYSPAVQSDQEENDETSAAYIKNRLAYTYQREIPEDEQALGYFDDWTEGDSQFEWQVISLEEAGVDDPLKAGFPSSTTSILQGVIQYPFLFKDLNDPVDFIKNSTNNKISAELYSGVNTIKSFEFDSNNVTSGRLESKDSPITITAFLSGNPIGANIFLTQLTEGEVPSLASFDTSNYTEFVDYILLFLVFELDDKTIPPYAMVAFIGDGGVYVSQAPDPSAVTFELKLLTQMDIYPIEEKYLSNIKNMISQVDQNEMDSSKSTYIKNRYGDVASFHNLLDHSSFDENEYYEGILVLGKEYRDGFEIESETVIHTFSPDSLETGPLQITAMDVEINGVKYSNCPCFYMNSYFTELGTVLNDSSPMLLYIGNPSYFTLPYELFREHFSDDVKISHLEDNGLPFLFAMDIDSPQPLKVTGQTLKTDVAQGDNVTIKIFPDVMNYATHVIPRRMLPRDIAFSPFIYDIKKESIMTQTAYEASGINSFAFGEGASALTDNSLAIGKNCKTEGKASFVLGENSFTGPYSQSGLAIGTQVKTSNPYGVALGYRLNSNGVRSLALGSDIYITNHGSTAISFGNHYDSGGVFVLEEAERPDARTAICTHWNFPVDQVLDVTHVTGVENSDGTAYSAMITSVTKDEENKRYIFKFATDIPISIIRLSAYWWTKVSGKNAFSAGYNNIVTATGGIAIGRGLRVDENYSTVLGKYNSVDAASALILGNGENASNRSNALTVDWNGNLKTAGSVETTSVVLSSPNGTKFKVTVDDSGILTSTEITE